jgi:uncharacterized phage protein gp47/JayE
MSEPCGCCAGVEIATPRSEANPPGLTALAYRVGDYATFYETMLARLSGLTLEIASPDGSAPRSVMPLKGLTTRDPADPSIALLDAWSVVCDVLTFYQERIANEGYLPTAIERRSLLELSRLIGYRLRPGVAATVKLAFTVSGGFIGTLPAGTRAQSIPGTGQSPQFFETAADLTVRDAWNALAPGLGRPQRITPTATDPDTGIPLVSGADVIDSVYVQGVSTNLNPGDALLFVFGASIDNTAPTQQYLRLAASIDPQAAQSRTAVTLALQVPQGIDAAGTLQLYVDKAQYLFPGSDIAAQVVDLLTPTIANLRVLGGSQGAVTALLQTPMSRIALLRTVALQRGFTRVTAWLTDLLQVIRLPLTPVDGADAGQLMKLPAAQPAAPLAGLVGIVDTLALAPSRQPANALRLNRSVTASFAPQSDMAPRLLAALHPAAAQSLYSAWSSLAAPAGQVEVYAARIKAGLFASGWAGAATVNTGDQVTTSFTAPTIATAWAAVAPDLADQIAELPLDTTYGQIKPGSWVAIERPVVDSDGNSTGGRKVTFHLVQSLRVGAVATARPGVSAGEAFAAPSAPIPTGFSAKVTLLTLQPSWLSEETAAGRYGADIGSEAVLRQTVVYAQTEPLGLTNEPLDTDIGGGSIDLDQVYAGLEPGRWVIVSGTRTDIPNVSGVTASELAMIAGVQQGAQPVNGQPFPLSGSPFQSLYQTTDADAFGDRLVVGQLSQAWRDFARQLQATPPPDRLNQQYAQAVELAPGLYANAYVPTAGEKRGHFPTFAGLVVNPHNQQPLPGGDLSKLLEDGIFAWRVSGQALNTVLNLAAPLAYKYDRASLTIYGNVADATQGQSTGEVLGDGDAARAWLSFALSQSPLTFTPAATAAGAASTLTVAVNDQAWTALDDLAEAGPKTRGYVTRENDAQKTTVTFGSGVRGARVPTGTANVKALYRYGMGSGGNVDAGQISQLATHPLGAQTVINPLPATGGADPDTLDQARTNAPLSVTALNRLVSVSDYADFCRVYAGVGKASAARLSDGRQLTLHVTVAGVEDSPIDVSSDLYANLHAALQTWGDPYQPVILAVRRVRLIVLAATVGLAPGYVWDDVAPKARAAVQALFAFDARELGQAAFQSEAVAVIQAVCGVAWVNITTFDSVAEGISAAQLAGLASSLRAWPYVRAELAQVNKRAQAGTAARIVAAELVFMTPDIADTLILTQAGA